MKSFASIAISACTAGLFACGGATPHESIGSAVAATPVVETPVRQSPPTSGPANDVRLPSITRSTLANGLELNIVEAHSLPVVYMQLVIRSGGETDPASLPGLSGMVAGMLKEGTKTRSSAQIAESVEFIGADLNAYADEESLYVTARATSDHAGEILDLLADIALRPAFSDAELRKRKTRELDRIALQNNDPNFLASRELYKQLYPSHPYAVIDTTAAAVQKAKRTDLAKWHKTFVVPNNAFLVVVGDVNAADLTTKLQTVFGTWKKGRVPETRYPELQASDFQVIVVDRPESVQSVIAIGGTSLRRSDAAFVPFQVANQVLGGSAASRLFMDLRERRSLTYGAYSRINETVDSGAFVARTSVRNEVTGQAVEALFEHLRLIKETPASNEEIEAAHRYLSDSFPLKIDTPSKVASLVADLRVFGLPDDYWETYRGAVRGVSGDHALEAAKAWMRPTTMVIVGRASDFASSLAQYGNVRVVDTEGKTTLDLPRQVAPTTN